MLNVASLYSGDCSESECECSRSCEILQSLLEFFVFDCVAVVCQREFWVLYRDESRIKQLLEMSSKEFQNMWKAMETVLLEQLLSLRLFDAGYLTERGACANVSAAIRQ